MSIYAILTHPVLFSRTTDCISPCSQRLSYSSFVYSNVFDSDIYHRSSTGRGPTATPAPSAPCSAASARGASGRSSSRSGTQRSTPAGSPTSAHSAPRRSPGRTNSRSTSGTGGIAQLCMGYSHTLSRGRMGFLPRELHAPKAHRAQLEGRGGMMLEGGENPFC